jgi:hypothetical protein
LEVLWKLHPCSPPKLKRVIGIIKEVKRFIPEYNINIPDSKDIWYGNRPCSADGLPYVRSTNKFYNLNNCIRAFNAGVKSWRRYR